MRYLINDIFYYCSILNMRKRLLTATNRNYINLPFKKNLPFCLFWQTVVRRYSVEKVFLEISQNSQENACPRVSFLINFIKKETLAQVFSHEFSEISKKTFFYGTPPVAASVFSHITGIRNSWHKNGTFIQILLKIQRVDILGPKGSQILQICDILKL